MRARSILRRAIGVWLMVDGVMTGVWFATLGTLDIRNNAKIGLPWDRFTTSADGATTTTSAVEYRQSYLKIQYGRCDVGLYLGAATNTPPTRWKAAWKPSPSRDIPVM